MISTVGHSSIPSSSTAGEKTFLPFKDKGYKRPWDLRHSAKVVPKNADGTPNPSLATHQILFDSSLMVSAAGNSLSRQVLQFLGLSM